MGTTTVLDMDQPFGKDITVGQMKVWLNEFCDDRNVSSKAIEFIRQQIALGNFHPYVYEEQWPVGTRRGCIIGLYSLYCFPHDLIERYALRRYIGYYYFESVLVDLPIAIGDTAETNPLVATLDAILALCQEERSQ